MLLSVFALIGCRTYYQVYTVSPSASTLPSSREFVFEEDSILFVYYFWSNGGNPGFLVINNNDNDIIIDVEKSFYIRNGFAYDYYMGREKTSTMSSSSTLNMSYDRGNLSSLLSAYGSSLSSYASNDVYGQGYVNVSAAENSVSVKEKDKIYIPSHSYKIISEYIITDEIYTNEELEKQPRKTDSLMFSENESPIFFGNRITVLSEDTEKQYVHSFYVSNIENITSKEMFGEEYLEYLTGAEVKNNTRKRFDRFYMVYKIIP